jgi:3-hydroxybutyryl-CoA dehydratase
VRPGDLVYAEVKVTGIQIDKRRVQLECKCEVGGKKVLVGEAMVMAPSRKFD